MKTKIEVQARAPGRGNRAVAALMAAALLLAAVAPAVAGEADARPDPGGSQASGTLPWLNPGASTRQTARVGPAVRPDDYKLSCADLRGEYERLGMREAELARAREGYAKRSEAEGTADTVTTVVPGLESLGTVLGGLFQLNTERTVRDETATGEEYDAVRARRDRVAGLMNDKRC